MAAFLAAVCVAFGVALALYVVSGKFEWSNQGVAHHIGRHVPFQSVRIIIVTWQILSQVSEEWRRTMQRPPTSLVLHMETLQLFRIYMPTQ